MKMFLTILFMTVVVAVEAQNFAVLPAWRNPERAGELAAGSPTNWPSIVSPLGESAVLPADKPSSDGWVVLSAAQLQAVKDSNLQARIIFLASQESGRQTNRGNRRQQIVQMLDDMQQVINATNNLSAAQVTGALKQVARFITFSIREGHLSLELQEP